MPGTINQILTKLDYVLTETDENKFIRLKQELIKFLVKSKFVNYLNTYYFQNKERMKSWAQCYQKNAGINTNMHAKSLHRSLKYKYFGGKPIEGWKHI